MDKVKNIINKISKLDTLDAYIDNKNKNQK